jgi:hypothetical protein
LSFVTNYWQAREHFIQKANDSGYRLLRFRVPHEESTELFQDFALLKRNPKKFLIHICGVHGIEGYAGSAIQSALVEKPRGETGPSILFIHAVNPLGMALFRRANGENVDLNRNFRAGKANPNPDYEYFQSYLNPKNKIEWILGPLLALYYKNKLGKERTGQAIASGQVTNAKGLFFMGLEIQREIHLVQELLKAHLSEAEEVRVLDFHTGLGEKEMLIVDRAQKEKDQPYFSSIFSTKIWVPDPKSNLYENQGRFSDSVRAALPKANVHYLLQELGTHGPTKTLAALRKENFDWFQRKAGSPREEKIAMQMLEAFCPSNAEWQSQALKLGCNRYEDLLASFSLQ